MMMNRSMLTNTKSTPFYQQYKQVRAGEPITPATPPGSPRLGARTPRTPATGNRPVSGRKGTSPGSPRRVRSQSAISQMKESKTGEIDSPKRTNDDCLLSLSNSDGK